MIVDRWSRLDPALQHRVSAAIERGAFERGDGAGALVPLRSVLCLCTDARPRPDAPLPVLHLPALRERAVDIRPLAEHFLRIAGRLATALADDAAELLSRHRWPGHVAELHDVMAAASWRATGPVLRASELTALAALVAAGSPAAPAPSRVVAGW